MLATSRVPLRLIGECEMHILALPVPNLAPQANCHELAQNPAVTLFVQRAIIADPHFVLSQDSAHVVAEICVRLDGLPLALELAAARCKVLSPAELLARLEPRLPMLSGGDVAIPARLRTMRDAIAWNYDLLEPVEQTLFQYLAAFAGGSTIDAIEHVWGCTQVASSKALSSADDEARLPGERLPHTPILHDALAALLNHGLIARHAAPSDEPRFVMLETIREFGLEQLLANGKLESTRQCHADYFMSLAEAAETAYSGPNESTWLARLERNLPNLREALSWAVEREGSADAALRLATSLWRYWDAYGLLSEGRQWLDRALDRSGVLPTSTVASALMWAGHLAWVQGDSRRAVDRANQSAEISRHIGDDLRLSGALCVLGNVAFGQGDLSRASSFLEEAFEVSRRTGDKRGLAALLSNLGVVLRGLGDFDRAASLYHEALALGRDEGNDLVVSQALVNLGELALARKEHRVAAAYLGDALKLLQRIGETGAVITECIEQFAEIALARDQPQRAGRLLGAAERRREAMGTPLLDVDRIQHECRIGAVRTALGADAFVAAWSAGRLLSLEGVIAEACAVAAEASTSPVVAKNVDKTEGAFKTLTPRELEVLRLIATGHTDREIAEALFISPHTATTHVKHILRKLGFTSRAAAAAYVARLGLT